MSLGPSGSLHLDLVLYRSGIPVAASRSVVDNIEHIHATGLAPGAYELKVERLRVANSGSSEPFAVAWWSTGPWTNLPPVVRISRISVGAGLVVTITFALQSGQAGGFELQGTADLNSNPTWTLHNLATLSQLNANTWQFTLLSASPLRRFYRVVALP